MTILSRQKLYIIFTLILAVQIFSWAQLRDMRSRWLNVPPVLSENSAAVFMPGDHQFSYRVIGLILQNMGDVGGRVTAFGNYDYNNLTQWFVLADRLDPHSNFVPFLAAFYFGSVEDPDKLRPLVYFLHDAGSRTEGEKWRWLAQAIYLARYKIKDMNLAYKWALELAAFGKPDMPMWTKQMPAFIRNDEGDKQAAYDIMVEILKSNAKKMPPEEINFMKDYICDRILDKAAADKNPLCQPMGN